MASKDLTKIEEILEMPVSLLQMYRDMFFDIVDLDKLSLLEIIEDAATPEEKGMKIWA